MARLVFLVVLVVAVKTKMDARGSRTMVLGFTLLMNMIAADSPVADIDEHLLYSKLHPEGFLGDVSSPTKPTLSTSLPFLTTALENQDTHVIPQPNYETFTPSNLNGKESQPLSTPSLHPSQLVWGSLLEFEEDKHSIEWKEAHIKSANQKTILLPTPLIPEIQLQLNESRPSAFERSAVPQRTFSKEAQNDRGSESTSTVTSKIGKPMIPQDFRDTPSDEAYILDDGLLYPTMSTLSIQQGNPLYSSGSTVTENKPLDVLPNPHEFLSPSYSVPFISPYLTPELTEAPPEDFYPTNTIDFDWGSGDFLETIAFLNPGEEDHSLVTKVPDIYDQEDNREHYNTDFPSRVGVSLSSLHHIHMLQSSSLMTASSTHLPLPSVDRSSLSPVHTTIDHILQLTPTVSSDLVETSDSIDWPDTYSIQPTDVLLPDMNSLEYYTTQLTKENSGSGEEVEKRRNVTLLSTSSSHNTHNSSINSHVNVNEDDSDHESSGFELLSETAIMRTTEIFNNSKPFLHRFDVTTHFLEPSSTTLVTHMLTADEFSATHTVDPHSTVIVRPSASDILPDDLIATLSLTDVQWFVTEVLNPSSILSPTTASSSAPTEHFRPSTERAINITSVSSNSTVLPPVMLGDQRVTNDEFDNTATMTLITTDSEANTTEPNAIFPNANANQTVNLTPLMSGEWQTTTPTSRQYLCNPEKPEYIVKIGLPSGAKVEHVKSQMGEILKREFNKSVELQVVEPPPKFIFRVVSDPVLYTAISVINALRRSGRHFLFVSPHWMTQDSKYQVHTVLQFVPVQVDVRYCNFSEHIERGLTLAYAEVCQRSKAPINFTVHIINITMTVPKNSQQLEKYPVDITFTVRGTQDYLMGSEVSKALMKLTKVEFSYYMGFPVQQIAEPFHYPKLNTSQFLRSSWVRTVLLGVLDSEVSQRTFQANIERRMAILLGEALGSVRRVKRATNVGNNSVQVVSMNRSVGVDNPLEVVYFVEHPDGQRVPAVEMANILNSLDVQKAAIILGYRVDGVLAQPVEKRPSLPYVTKNPNLWIIIGVVIPLLVVIFIIALLYFKLCRTDKLEFQPDAMTSIQQRHKLQAPSVKGFDFAKLHLGQQNKDDVIVVQESFPAEPVNISDMDRPSLTQNGDVPNDKNSASSTKASRSFRRRERISPSDGDSMVSDRSSGRESTEENLRAQAPPSDSKQTRKNRIGPHPPKGLNEQMSSASIFEHVDRMSRATDVSRRLPNKVQLIAMQPMTIPPLLSHTDCGKLSDTCKSNKEIQIAMRQKSEMEHHRNKIRLRGKRKGHYDFPAMDDIDLAGVKEQDHVYHKAQKQMDKMDQNSQIPTSFKEPPKSARGKPSPKQRMKEQLNGGVMTDADKDKLITEDSEAAYRKCPGVNNVAYVSDADQASGLPHRSPSPTDEVFLGPACSPPGHAPPPPPYMPPQPSIEEARQQMHSLLDDAFALVSPTSQGSSAGITLPGVNVNASDSRLWGPSYQGLAPYTGRFSDLSLSPPLVQGLISRQERALSYLPPRETVLPGEQLQLDRLYSIRGLYTDELPMSARPWPVGGTTGAQLHHLTQVGLPSRINGYPSGMRGYPGPNGSIRWNDYPEEPYYRTLQDNSAMARSDLREPSSPPARPDLETGYLSTPLTLDARPPTQSSASLIKAIREELLRLSQKQGFGS
ncbi:UPF0606 protein KIAA1549 isoform X9 [Stigmatopora argus]